MRQRAVADPAVELIECRNERDKLSHDGPARELNCADIKEKRVEER